jgi:tetratricopeptide (TPR) repeat protein
MTDQAADRYREALRRGHLAVARGRPREAIAHYQEAAGLAEHRSLPLVAMASVHLQMRQPREAIRACDEALKRAPGDVAAMRGKAAALEADGRAAEASVIARRAAELESMERAGRPGGVAVDGPNRDPELLVMEGIEARAANELDRCAAAFHAAALRFAASDALDAAIDACLRALEACPGAIDVHFTMAHLYLRRGWSDLAVQRVTLIDHRLAVDADPRRQAALQALARDYRSLAPELERLANSSA